eukprot:TRINITY_DN83_c0_g1_i1.p1 TRINITY_DN83_c0_g1~~TRINITY_DN83_c0_g1_i1.p1  ORF type:complete len:486 (+),score=113.17 TRINITY_DN83_c0_g1_i1:116-1573(+)
MVCSTMLPPSAFQNVNAADVAAAATSTPMSDCQSPLDRWLGLPASTKTMSAKQPSLMPMPEQEPAAFAYSAQQPPVLGQLPVQQQQQYPMPTMQMQPSQFTQLQLPQQVFQQVGASQQGQEHQPTWVYFMPVGAQPPVPAPIATHWPYPQNVFGAAQQGCAVEDGVLSCSTDISPGVANSSDSDEEGSKAASESTQRLTASQARRRRRQRAAGFARAEQLQQQQQQYTAAFAAPRGMDAAAVNPASAPILSAEMCARLSEQLKAGGEATHAALASLARSARRFCFDSQGCRVLQLAIEKGSHTDVAMLLKELHGCVLRAATSPHGNFVLQKVVEVMPAAASRFIAEEFRGHAAEMAFNKFGCRILCRLLEHASGDERTVQLTEELLLAKAGDLIRHEFGHHVIESILEHGMDNAKQLIILSLEQEMPQNVLNRSALFVLDRAVSQSTPHERSCLGAALRRTPETSRALNDPILMVQLRSILGRSA